MAITVSEQSLRRAITRSNLRRRLHCPNLPSMALHAELSASCAKSSGSATFAGRPSLGPGNRIPRSAQYRRFSRFRNSLPARAASG